MNKYKPDYNTTIETRTVVEKLPTVHRDGIDWSYPFDDPQHTTGICCSEEEKHRSIEEQKEWLRQCEAGGNCWVSSYGGWSRIFQRLIKVCMASCWPYWTPRPTLIVDGTLGVERMDWRSLTGFERRTTRGPAAAKGAKP